MDYRIAPSRRVCGGGSHIRRVGLPRPESRRLQDRSALLQAALLQAALLQSRVRPTSRLERHLLRYKHGDFIECCRAGGIS